MLEKDEVSIYQQHLYPRFREKSSRRSGSAAIDFQTNHHVSRALYLSIYTVTMGENTVAIVVEFT